MNHNYKMMHYCQRCNKQHDRTNESMFETSVKCDFCEGFVVSPSGRAIIRLVLTVGMYIVYGETKLTWIIAKNKQEATNYFKENMESEFDRAEKLSEKDLQESQFCFDPDQRGIEEDYLWSNGKNLLTLTEKVPTFVHIIDREVFEEAVRRKSEEDNES